MPNFDAAPEESNVLKGLIKDTSQQKAWLESLSESELKKWIKNLIYSKDEETKPLFVHKYSRPISHVSLLLRECNSETTAKIKPILCELLEEWDNSKPESLDYLLIFVATIGCREAEDKIIEIFNKLKDNPTEENLAMQGHCLRVISGFGPNEKNENIFQENLSNIKFAPTCYRALYRLRKENAVDLFDGMFDLFNKEGKLEDLKHIIFIFLHDYIKSDEERVEFWKKVNRADIEEDFKKYFKSMGINNLQEEPR